jgi:tetratricopeptide (TPR) repeat protein
MKKLKITLLTVFLIFPFSFVSSQDLECFIIEAPEKYLEGVKKIAIIDFDVTTRGYNVSGDKGQVLNDYMTSNLLQEYRGIHEISGGIFGGAKEGVTYIQGATTNVYEVIERNRLFQVLEEQEMSQSGIIDENQAVELGKILGIDAMIIGTISFHPKDEKVTKRYENSISYCTKRVVTTEARMKIISVQTGQIIGTKELSQAYSDTKCDEKRSGLTSVSKLTDYCLKDIAYWLVNYFTPRYKLVKYEFGKIRNRDFKDQAKDAEKYLKDGDIDNAFAIYNAIYEADPYNAIAADNVASLYDIVGNYEKAVEYWQIAAELDPKNFQKSLEWGETELANEKILNEMVVFIEEYQFLKDSDALAEKVTTKGRKSERYEVYESPDKNSRSIAKVPGDTEFVVLEKNGDWLLIKLLGNKQGYINESDVN